MKKLFKEYPDVVSINDLMIMLDIGKRTAYKLLRDGNIKSVKAGRQYKIPKQSIIDYLKT